MKSILGIGNAITDVFISLPDSSLLEQFSIAPGSIAHVSREEAQSLLDGAEVAGYNVEWVPGGSAANTVALASDLGLKCGFIGKVGADAIGDNFIGSLKKNGVKCFVSRGENASGVGIVLSQPCGTRTFVVSPGAALALTPEELRLEFFEGFDHLHLEGFIMECPGVAPRAMQLAKEQGLTVSFDIGSQRIARKHNALLKQLIGEYADMVFATVEEATAYTGSNHKGIAPVTVIKNGAAGSVIYCGNEEFRIEAHPAQVMDTTGAGDSYAAGFFHALSQGLPLPSCGHAGSAAAAQTISRLGGRR